MKKIAGFILLLIISISALKATHITHGNIYYEYLGKDNDGDWRYKISLVLYRDCLSSQVGFDDNIEIAVYNGDGQRSLEETYYLFQTGEQDVKPINIVVNSPNSCYKRMIYSKEIIFTPNASGYYVVWNRCCKTPSNNLVDENATNYTVFIPSELNSSASLYSNAPIGAITNTVINVGLGVEDKDGDSITYKLTNSLNGPLAMGTAVWDNIEVSLAIPIKSVQYRNGYSGIKPIGNDGFASVSSTGILDIQSNKQGKYFISVLVSEWRNGQLLTENVRDFVVHFFVDNISSTEVFLKAETFLEKEITLNWGMAIKSFDADSFRIERRLKGASNWSYLTTTAANKYGFNDTSVLYDTLYQYQVTAHLNNGSSKASNISEAIVRSWRTNSIAKIQVNKFTVYPNPVSNMLYINSVNQIDVNMVTITDIQGKVVLQNKNVSDALANGINVSPLPQGVYLLKVVAKNGSIEIQKIIKQ
jgi:hypothetical protein